MYYGLVAALMFALPLLSVGSEAAWSGAVLGPALIAKWFAFWSVGLRLLLAGVRQIVQPTYTAKEILGMSSGESVLLVRELGFANAAMGTVAVVSMLMPSWRLAASLTGGVFYVLAGANHVLQPHRNKLESVAMISDLFVGVVLLGVVMWSVILQSAA